MIEMQRTNNKRRIGFTLIEILVVVSILLILTSILVPRLRMVTQERNIREAARVVGSMFSQASQRGVIDGTSGVILLRNSNITDGSGFIFGSTQIGLLRRVPSFRGDTPGAVATVSGTTVTIDNPIEQSDLQIILEGDSISFGTSSIEYVITGITEDTSNDTLMLEIAGLVGGMRQSYLPPPPPGGGEYTIRRLPRLLRSSLTDLPSGHLIDLRFSGCQTAPGNALLQDAIALGDFNVVVLVDDQGKFDRMLYVDDNSVEARRIPQGPFYAFVTAGETDGSTNPLSQETNLWVSLTASGIVNVGYNVAQDVALNLVDADDVTAARGDSLLGPSSQ